MVSQWPEGWKTYHEHGLECIITSGRILASLFDEPYPSDGKTAMGLLPERDPANPWVYFVAGRLLAGVGAEVLFKGLYLKRGYSIRKPDNPRKQTLASLRSAKAQRFNPRISASFGVLLQDHNLKLVGDPQAYKPLMVGKWWRDDSAHTALGATGDAGVELLQFGMALRCLHDELLKDAGQIHAEKITEILRKAQPFGPTKK